jgi:hypothetical protein
MSLKTRRDLHTLPTLKRKRKKFPGETARIAKKAQEKEKR